MFGRARCIALFFFPHHFAHGRGYRSVGTPQPSHREIATWLSCDFVRWLKRYCHTGFHLQDIIGKRLEFTRVFVMHVRHEDTEFVLRQPAKHLLNFREVDRLLSSSQCLWQTTGALL